MKIVNKTYNLKKGLNKNIVLISDIHYYEKKQIKHFNNILDNIKKINPDYICISGDILDKAKVPNFNGFVNWLEKLANITKVIMVLGNHEYYINRRKDIYGLNEDYINKIKNIENLYLLDNNNLIIDNINFIGLTLPIEYYMFEKESEEDFKKYIKNIKTKVGYYNVLLCHSPINIVKDNIIKDIDVDLILCGHTHGGVVPWFLRGIFGTSGIISPSKSLFPKKCYGRMKKDNKNIIITSGITMLAPSHLKLVNKSLYSEVVKINL